MVFRFDGCSVSLAHVRKFEVTEIFSFEFFFGGGEGGILPTKSRYAPVWN